MKTLAETSELRRAVAEARAAGKRIGFVPTMGALHAGHASLLRLARKQTDFLAASIFVNPTQFGPREDLSRYPRPLQADQALCASEGCDLLFTPSAATIYPAGFATFVAVEGLSDVLEGASRPGHFRGVATVVSILFHLVQPDVAYFGQKDGQQVAVIRRMVRDLALPIELVVGPTVREPDGLALSSRNVYLSADERRNATVLFRALELGRKAVAQGEKEPAALQAAMAGLIQATSGAELDYLAFVDPETLAPREKLDQRTMAALAVRFGSTRLIDNMIYETAAAQQDQGSHA